MAARINALLAEFATEGTADMALADVLFDAMCDTLSAHIRAAETDPDATHAMGRYNQISRIAGVLEVMSVEARNVWVERLCRVE